MEDNASHYGPVALEVSRSSSVKELKDHVERAYKFPRAMQRWIFGKSLLDDESATLQHSLALRDGCNIYLYIAKEEDARKPDDVSVKVENGKKTVEDKDTEKKHVKGRYWNFESNRWSICSDDDDDEDGKLKAARVAEKSPKVTATDPVVEKPDKVLITVTFLFHSNKRNPN